ncbi:protein of unknown function [Tessaracoccus bendigoensis DSM 12906]|uniref:DUF4194 domain-containing protein n=1 Tax=Tessaracoccus bendigoensis DSM 12906 TaxID=1123357 RepID=A0A1M6A2P1_9ACTN|nr:DUF4194 domain-containing protein [Tessaracoccus bendigoensis]SHI30771.1 protein of unknown function [Tessaracoccus bendigoensis DSM 12906]
MSMQSAPRRAEGDVDEFEDDAVAVEAPDDPSELDAPTRRLLLKLLNGPYVRAEEHSNLWTALEVNETVVRSRLADLYLQLVLDRDAGVAFVRNLAVEDAPKVVRRHPLTLLDTVLVLYLRRLLLANQGSAARVFVGRDEIEDHLRGFLRSDTTDKSAQEAKVGRSIAKMTENSILLKAEVEDRWEISPVLRLVFGADEVAAVTADLERMAGQ